MTQEDKELLLKDLCARLPYGVHIHSYCPFDQDSVGSLYSLRECKGEIRINDLYYIEEVKPYLFPLSSMTEEQKKELRRMNAIVGIHGDIFFATGDEYGHDISITHEDAIRITNWLNKNQFDYRGLIPMGLAIDATGLNIY